MHMGYENISEIFDETIDIILGIHKQINSCMFKIPSQELLKK